MLRITRVFPTRGVGENGDPGRVNGDFFQGIEKRLPGVGNEGTVKRGGHRQQPALDLALRKYRLGTRDLTRRTRQNCLVGGIPIGEHQVKTLFTKHGCDDVERRPHSQHRTPISGTGSHESATQQRQGVTRRGIDPSRGAQGRQFTVAVPCHRLRPNVEVLHDAQGPEAQRTQGRLSDVGGAKDFFVFQAILITKHRNGINTIA